MEILSSFIVDTVDYYRDPPVSEAEGIMIASYRQGIHYFTGPDGILMTYKDNQQHGLFYNKHDDGTTVTCNYSNGKLHGIYQRYYPNGTLSHNENYVNDQLHGMSISWYPNGRLQAETFYFRGKKHGVERSWDYVAKLYVEHVYVHGEKKW